VLLAVLRIVELAVVAVVLVEEEVVEDVEAEEHAEAEEDAEVEEDVEAGAEEVVNFERGIGRGDRGKAISLDFWNIRVIISASASADKRIASQV
jgi:hypothetical protein